MMSVFVSQMPINAGSEQPPSPMAAQNDSSSVAMNGGGNSFGQAKSPIFTTKVVFKLSCHYYFSIKLASQQENLETCRSVFTNISLNLVRNLSKISLVFHLLSHITHMAA